MLIYGLITYVVFVIYVSVGVWLVYLRWPLRAGLSMAALSTIPLWAPTPVESEAPGSGFLTAVMMMPAILLIAIGLIAAAVRWLVSSRKTANGTSLNLRH